MKIRVNKREMATLLDAMLLRASIQDISLGAAQDTVDSLRDDSEDKDRAIANAKKAIAALTGTELEGCEGESCPGHLSKEAVQMARDAQRQDGTTAIGRLVQINVELREKNEALAAEMEAMRTELRVKGESVDAVNAEIERLKALPTIDHSNCGSKAEGSPGETTTEPWKVCGEIWFEWWAGRNGWTDEAVREAVNGAARWGYGAGVLAERERKVEVPQKVHVVVAERTPPAFPFVYVFAGSDDAVRKFRDLWDHSQYTATFHTERIVPDSGEKLPLEEGKEVAQME